MPFVLAFVVVGVVELAVFAAVWDAVGPAWTIGLALTTGVVGSTLVWRQGLSMFWEMREALVLGRFPGRELVHGALILVGGALLLTPGFVTDLVGLGLMAPPIREVLRLLGRRWIRLSV